MSSEEFWKSEFMRQLGNIVTFGKVIDLDAASARVKVQVGGNNTAWIPWLAHAAGKDRQWSAPEAGEQVVILAPTGDMAQGVVLRGAYSGAFPAPANSADVTRTQWDGGAFVQYDRVAKAYELSIPAGGPGIRLVCGNSVVEVKDGEVKITADLLTVVAPTTTLSGDLQVAGAIVAQGEVTGGPAQIPLSGHKHIGVVGGSSQSGTPVP